MSRPLSYIIVFAALVSSACAAPPKAWGQLKKGMTPDEALVLLGQPLMRNVNRGYELWIYDSKAEVVFHQGPVMAWTIPTPNPVSEARPIEMDLPLNVGKRLPFFNEAKPQATDPQLSRPSTHFRYEQRF